MASSGEDKLFSRGRKERVGVRETEVNCAKIFFVFLSFINMFATTFFSRFVQ